MNNDDISIVITRSLTGMSLCIGNFKSCRNPGVGLELVRHKVLRVGESLVYAFTRSAFPSSIHLCDILSGLDNC